MDIQEMIDSVVDGKDPGEVIQEITTMVKISPGMARYMSSKNTKYKCDDCEMGIPKYRGAYTKSCPNCGGNLTLQG